VSELTSELWMSASGKVHLRRMRWYVGTPDERVAPPTPVIMMCGQRGKDLKPTDDRVGVTCLTCQGSMGTGAHHL
jgi:hypothetical protein